MPRSLYLMLLLMGGTLAAQNSIAPKQPFCSISGQVVQESAGTPLRNVMIILSPSEGSIVFSGQDNRKPHTGATDSEGHFQLEGIQPGEYRVFLQRNGFLASTRRSRLYSSTLLSLSPGQELQGLLFRMRPTGVIKGRVVDEDGDAVPGVSMVALSVSGHEIASNVTATTNDLGEYRIAGLPEGKFLVLAQPEMNADGDNPKEGKIYAPTYYPGILDRSQAARIEVHAGDETSANFNLISSRTFTVKGRVFGLRPQTQPTAQRRMVRDGSSFTAISPAIMLERLDSQGSQSSGAPIAEDGSFEIQSVLPGSYEARISSEYLMRVRANQTVEVRDADIDGIQLTTESSVELRGRFRMNDGAKMDWRQIQIVIDPDDTKQVESPLVARMQADGTFIIENVQPGSYHVVVTSSSASLRDYIVKEVNVDGREVGDSGFSVGGGGAFLDIVGSAKGSAIEGSAVDDQGKPIPDAQVVCIPDATRRKRHDIYQQVQTDQRGYFSLRGLNAGEYQVFALDDAPSDITDQDFVSAHEGQGETVKVEAGERKSIVLKLPPPAD